MSADPILVDFVVAAGKTEQSRSRARIAGGRIVETGVGLASDAADATLTLTPADAQAVRDGNLDLSVGFMRGQIKMAGDPGALLRALPVLRSTAHELF